MAVEEKIVALGVTGTVKRLVKSRGWGWITRHDDDGAGNHADIFVRQDDVDVDRGFSSLGFSNYCWANVAVGDQVKFDIIVGKKVPRAINVRYMFVRSNIRNN